MLLMAIAPPGLAAGKAAEPPAVTRIEADSLTGQTEQSASAQGRVEIRKGNLFLRADRVDYNVEQDKASATGAVMIRRPGAVFRGPEMQLRLEVFEGFIIEPEFELERSRSGGRGRRVDLLDAQRFTVEQPIYTSCPRDGSADPDWLLTARRLRVDLQANEAVAESARLYFMGVPVFALPVMSFPATSDRKSGWLSPLLRNDSRSGLQLSLPYYWNLAPDRDLTFTPRRSQKRGFSLDTEFRYLLEGSAGLLALETVPRDALTETRRHSLRARHEGAVPAFLPTAPERRTDAWAEFSVLRVSDEAWWKDFQTSWLPLDSKNAWWRESSTSSMSLTPRLLPLRAVVEQPLRVAGVDLLATARLRRWQVLQDSVDPVGIPYDQTSLLLSTPGGLSLDAGWRLTAQAGAGAFGLPAGQSSATRPTGNRLHLLAQLSRRTDVGLGWVEPSLGLNAATYRLDTPLPDGQSRLSRWIPSLGIDAGTAFERNTVWFGRPLRQTLEPRLMAVRTPRGTQSPYLLFDSAERDLSQGSIFLLNDFSGIDRSPAAQHLNAGVVNRLLDAAAGVELLRLEVAQRYQVGVSPVPLDPLRQSSRASDLFVLGSTQAIPSWALSAWVRWSAQDRRPNRSVLSATYAPDPLRSLAAAYRYNRGAAEQLETSWKWPLGGSGSPAGGCSRRWTTVGQAVYSAVERRVVGTATGLEMDSGCFSSRLVLVRQASGSASATIVQFQFELKGLYGQGSTLAFGPQN